MTDPLSPGPSPSVELIAHRGYSAVAPENTLSALDAAMEAGIEAVEFDVRTALCGTPVLFHDSRLGRTSSGVGPLKRRTLTQLRSLDVGAWFSEEFTGERIPTLEEALDRLRDRVGRIYVEVKGYREMEDLDRMVEIVRRADLVSRTVFISLDPIALARIGDTEPALQLGSVLESEDGYEDALDRSVSHGRSFLDLEAELALRRPELVRRARDRGVDVGVWTVDDPGDAAALVDLGVTRITTNQVSLLLEWRRERGDESRH